MDFLKASFSGPSGDIEEAKNLFEAVKAVFPGENVHNQLPWNLATSSTKAALSIMRTDQGMQMTEIFVDHYLFKIVDLLLQQQ